MTPPEQKAKMLVEKFRPFAHKNFTMEDDGETEKAKQCSLIAVDMEYKSAIKMLKSVQEYLPLDILAQAEIFTSKEMRETKKAIETLK